MIKICKLIIFTLAVAFPATSFACATKTEENAFDVRALKNSLMVAALTCGHQDQYNKFVNRYQNSLSSSGEKIEGYFARTYGSNSKKRLNTFITDLANNASHNAAESDQESYCVTASQIFSELLHADELNELAEQEQFASLHNIDGCS